MASRVSAVLCHSACLPKLLREGGSRGRITERISARGTNLEMKAEGESENQYEKREQMEERSAEEEGKGPVDQGYL